MAPRLYHLTGPTEWAKPPERFSFSSLKAIERCPLQWQLGHSQYGDLDGFPSRPHPAAVEGEIVHALLDRLFRRLALAGFPDPGTDRFRSQVALVDVPGSVRRLVQDHEKRIAQHPRGGGFRMTKGTQQLVNQVIRFFREAYATAAEIHRQSLPDLTTMAATPTEQTQESPAALLQRRRVLSEWPVEHPSLPFRGVIDLLWLAEGGPVISDFKTGQEREDHGLQVSYYALVWWRVSEMVPMRVEVRYPSRIHSLEVTTDYLESIEADLRDRIRRLTLALQSRPAKAKRGEHCRHCEVRSFCPDYWADPQTMGSPTSRSHSQAIDLELTVMDEPTTTGFTGVLANGKQIAVVFEDSLAKVHGPFTSGERVRLLGAQLSHGGSIELKEWTEVFHGRST